MKLETRPPAPVADPTSVRRGLGIDAVWASIAVLLPALVILVGRMGTIDLAYHLRAGEEILRTHVLPGLDTYSFSATGARWVDQQWGAQVALALTARLGGFASLMVLRSALVAGSLGLVYRACRERGAAPAAASALALGSMVMTLQSLAMRPQLLAVPLFAGTLLILIRRETHPRTLWAVPVITLIWANLHGSFVMAPGLVGLALIEDLMERRLEGAKRLLWVAIATVAATVVNPFGPGVWRYAFTLSTDPEIRKSVTEWAPIAFGTYAGTVFFGSALAIAIWLARRSRSVPWPDLLWLVTFFIMTLPAARGVMWWGIVAPVVVAGLLPEPRPDDRGERTASVSARRIGSPPVNGAIVAALVVACVVALPYRRPGEPDSLLRGAPGGLVRAAAAEVPSGGRLFVSQPWGSWFEYALPTDTVFVDSRIELYPAAVWDDYVHVRDARQGWQGILDRYRADAVIFDPTAWELSGAIAHDPHWRLVYRDADGVLYVRS